MDFYQLKYCLTIYEEKTLKSASEKLFITSSALSQFVSRLENEFRTPLFNRTKEGWIPTKAGHIYIDMEKEILNIQKKAYKKINDCIDNKAGVFSVGITPGRGTVMFSSIYPDFKNMYPNVTIDLVEGNVRKLAKLIAEGQVDIGFLTSGVKNKELTFRKLMGEKIVMVVPRTHPLSSVADSAPDGDFAAVELSLFKDDKFLLMGEGTTLRDIENQMFADAGFEPQIALETGSLLTLNSLSKNGYAISFVPRFYAEQAEHAVYFNTIPSAEWELCAVYRKDSYISSAQEYLISLVTDYYNGNVFDRNLTLLE